MSLSTLSQALFPEATIRFCGSAFNEEGRPRWRVCFKAPELSAYRVVAYGESFVEPKHRAVFKLGFALFTIKMDGIHQAVYLNRESLRTHFKISNRLLERAEKKNDLMRIVCLKIFNKNWAAAPALAQRRGDALHFSAKDYNIPRSIYVTQEGVFFAVKGKIGGGSHAKVKRAETLNGKIVARRIALVNRENIYRLRQMVGLLKNLRGPGIIDLLGVCPYKSLGGHFKVVTFHSLYQYTLRDVFNCEHDKQLSKEMILSLIDQLFQALLSLNGAHGDLKPENILVDLKEMKLVLIDLEFYLNRYRAGPYHWGTPRWKAPEGLSQWGDVRADKFDVWAAGILACHFFQYPHLIFLPQWDCPENELRTFITQEVIDDYLEAIPLSEKKKSLLRHMLVVDPKWRWSIGQAADYFREHILNGSEELAEQVVGSDSDEARSWQSQDPGNHQFLGYFPFHSI